MRQIPHSCKQFVSSTVNGMLSSSMIRISVVRVSDMAASNLLQTGIKDSSPRRPLRLWLGTGLKLHSGYGRALFYARNAEVVHRWYKMLHELSDYNRILKVGASANRFLYTISSFSNATLERLDQFWQGTFQKGLAAFTATEERIWSPIVNKEGERVDRKNGGEGRARYTSTSNLLLGYMEWKNMCLQQGSVLYGT